MWKLCWDVVKYFSKKLGKECGYAEGCVGSSLHPPRVLLELIYTCTTGEFDSQMVTRLLVNILV